MVERKNAVIAMSGGVDSSVAAWLMQQREYALTGVTLKLICDVFTKDGAVEDSSCCSVEDIRRAKDNCRVYGFPHHVLNFSKAFRERIVDNFAEEYFLGRTPNPCVICNREMKWTELLQWMDGQGIEYLATGHYAQVKYNEESGRYELWRGRDRSKDQSYVLWMLDQDMLKRTVFPLGDMEKPEVRRIAAELGLSNADKADSQDICFVPDNNYRNFLEAYDARRSGEIGPGNFVDIHGRVLGRHRGYYHYTVGQRRGLALAVGEPVYVKAILPESNEVVVVPRGELVNRGCVLSRANWVSVDGSERVYRGQVKIRYRHGGIAAELHPLKSGKIVVNFTGCRRIRDTGSECSHIRW